MPIYNWNKYRDTEKGRYLIKEVNKEGSIKKYFFYLFYGVSFAINPIKYNLDFYSKAWNKLYQQYVDKFGLEDSFKERIDLLEKRFDLITQYFSKPIDKRDRFIITKIKAINVELDLLKTKKPVIDFESVKVYVDKWLNSYLDDKTCSVVQYQYYLKEMSKPQTQYTTNASD